MVYSQQPAPFYAVDILFFALSRQAVHEIDIYVFEPYGSGQLYRLFSLPCAVYSAYGPEQAIVKALNADGYPVEARLSVCGQLAHLNGARVALYCSFGYFQVKFSPYALHCGAYKLERYCRRRTSPEKYRVEFFAAALCRSHRYLLIKRLEIRICPALFREGNKVAIGALLNAEGDVEIYSRHFSLCEARS